MGELVWELLPKRVILSRLEHGSDIMESIKRSASSVNTGVFTLIGALSSVDLGYYDQKEHRYKQRSFEGAFEITSCTGNISIKDGERFVHAHISLADDEYKLIGGHLLGGRVFAAELHLIDLDGAVVREHDPVTDLFLWRRS